MRTVKVEGEPRSPRKIMADIKKESRRESWLARRNSSSCKTKVRVRVSAIIVLAAAWHGRGFFFCR